MKFFNYDSPFWSFMSRIADLVIVNILWLVFCIPVFTIGASTAAMLSLIHISEPTRPY